MFEHVAHLLVPDASPEALDASLRDLRRQLMELRTDAFRHGLGQVIEKLDRIESRLSEAERDIDAAHGGDADAAQRARRALLDVDATMTEADLARKWPAISASSTVGMYGTEAERTLLQDVMTAMDKARRDKDAAELERQMRLAQRLSNAAFNRTPEAWEWYFEDAASEVSKCRDLPRAQRLVTEGKAALERGDNPELRRVVKALWQLLPENSEARKKGFDSGVR
jgi:molecular chaperone DnaK